MKKTAVLASAVLFICSSVFAESEAGPRMTIAVADFENKAGVGSEIAIGSGMAEMLTEALFKSGKFNVVERQALGGIIAEQDLRQSGRAAQGKAAQIGKIQSAQILVSGAVTQFATNTLGGGAGVRIKGFDVGLKTSEAIVAVDIRLYDSTTSQIIDTQHCVGKVSATGLNLGYSEAKWGINTEGFKKTPLGQAAQKAIDDAVKFVVARTKNIPWQGRVINFKDGMVYINAGREQGIAPGQNFVVYSVGEEMIDPETGASLGTETTRIGRVQVSDVQDKFSKAKVLDGDGFKRDDIVKAE